MKKIKDWFVSKFVRTDIIQPEKESFDKFPAIIPKEILAIDLNIKK